MINKFLANKNGGGIGSVNYLLNKKRVLDGTARLLKGEEHITRALIDSIGKKQKTTFAVMSFQEANIDEAIKFELMGEWEKTFLPGLKPDQYNVLWVEHTDKGRLELNVIVPKIELTTGRALNPYFHGSDFHLADMFQKKMNLKYGFSDPQDPSKAQSVRGSRKQIGLFKDYQALDSQLKELVTRGDITSRAEMISILKDSGVEVTRQGADYISVKLPDSKKARRLQGGIYEKQFTNNQELGRIGTEQERRERDFAAKKSSRVGELEAITKRLDSAVEKRTSWNQKQFGKPKRAAIQMAEASRNPSPESITIQPTMAVRAVDKKFQRKVKNDDIRKAVDSYDEERAGSSRGRDSRAQQRASRHHRVADLNLIATGFDFADLAGIEERARERREEIDRANHRRDITESLERLPEFLERITTSVIVKSLQGSFGQLYERISGTLKELDQLLVQSVKLRNQIARFANGRKPVVADKSIGRER